MSREPDKEEISRILDARCPRNIMPYNLKSAAVLVPLFQKNGKWHVLLTRRTQNVEHHKGEISFPGGHKDPEDPDLLYTALRETEEEVGIPKDQVEPLGRLDDIETITGFRIRPFVGVIPHPFPYRPAEAEIEEIIELPLEEFMKPGACEKKLFTKKGEPYPVYYFKVRGYNVWGATAKILRQFLALTMGFKDPEPGEGEQASKGESPGD